RHDTADATDTATRVSPFACELYPDRLCGWNNSVCFPRDRWYAPVQREHLWNTICASRVAAVPQLDGLVYGHVDGRGAGGRVVDPGLRQRDAAAAKRRPDHLNLKQLRAGLC